MNDNHNTNNIPQPAEAPYDWAGIGHCDDLSSEHDEHAEVRGTFAAEPACEPPEDAMVDLHAESPYDGWEGCWPGDGSGMDDLADLHANEGGDW